MQVELTFVPDNGTKEIKLSGSKLETILSLITKFELNELELIHVLTFDPKEGDILINDVRVHTADNPLDMESIIRILSMGIKFSNMLYNPHKA